MASSHIQASSNLFFDTFSEHDPGNLLLEQCRREVLEQQLKWTRLCCALERLEHGILKIMYPPKVMPLAFSLMVDKLRERVSSETLADSVARMQKELETAAGKGAK